MGIFFIKVLAYEIEGNLLVPISNTAYYDRRETIAIQPNVALDIGEDVSGYRLHPSFTRLAGLYGEETGAATARRVARILETHKQLRNRSVVGPLWTHKDIVLITYGDSVQSPAQHPLQTLRNFLKRHLPDAFSISEISPSGDLALGPSTAAFLSISFFGFFFRPNILNLPESHRNSC